VAVLIVIWVAPEGPDQISASDDPRRGRLQAVRTGWSPIPPHPCPEAQGHGGQEHDCRGEARQVRLHDDSFVVGSRLVRRPGGLGSSTTRDPWLCVATSRWLCPGRPWCGGRFRPRCERRSTSVRGHWPIGTRGSHRMGMCRPAPRGSGRKTAGRTADQAGAASSRRDRIATAITTTIPSPMSRSPMLTMLLNGSQAGIAITSVRGSSAGCSRIAVLE
jgi:hypothetical protein